jgi:type VI secretion system protein ImpC
MPDQTTSESKPALGLTADGTEETRRLIEGLADARKDTAAKLNSIFELEDEKAKSRLGRAIDDVLIRVLEGQTVKGNLITRITQARAWVDKRLAEQVNAVIHHPDFRTLEGAWRGLKYLVDRKPPGQHIQIRVLNISKKELAAVTEKYSAESGQLAWDQSPVFKQIFEQRFDMPGGNPFGCLVGDYQFDKSAPDVDLLKRMAAICGAAHAPFISAASPNLVSLKSWRDLPDPAELEAKMTTPDYANWNDLRQSDDSRYLALTLPRMLARMPYGEGKTAEGAFKFEEDLRPVPDAEWSAGETKHDNYIWSNAAYAMAANIANTFHDTGFCVNIRGVESGGKVEGLPIDTFPTDDGGIDSKCPTEVAISQRREAELARLGFMPLSHWQNTNFAAFVGAQTVQKPQQYETAEATANAELSARLPYVFLVSRFAHYLKKMLYEWVGTNKERDQLEKELNEWIMLYASAPTSADNVKQEKPLAEASIKVKEIEGKPGYYEAFAYLRPHIQLEGVTVNLGVVQKLPKGP